MAGRFSKQFWDDLASFSREYWVEVILFFVFVTLVFALGIYLF